MNDEHQLRRRAVGPPAARSVLLTTLGEYVLSAPEGVWQETLIAALGTLGYKPQAARQALARSVTAGWLSTERHGRRARLRLTAPTERMLRAGAARIYGFGEPWEWNGEWLLIILRVPEQRREVRHQLRTQLAWAGFGSLGGGLWISPHVQREQELRDDTPTESVAELQSFRARLGTIGDPATLLADAWDLDEVAASYRAFTTRFRALRPKTPEAIFCAQTMLVHEWRRFPFLDPDLPESILPAGWPRSHAHDVFAERHARWHDVAQDYFRSLEGLTGAADRSEGLARAANRSAA
jgi:phenylacetic acid degradation operon negative regulatory protein